MVDDKQVGIALSPSPQSQSDLNQNDWITIKRLIPSLLQAASVGSGLTWEISSWFTAPRRVTEGGQDIYCFLQNIAIITP